MRARGPACGLAGMLAIVACARPSLPVADAASSDASSGHDVEPAGLEDGRCGYLGKDGKLAIGRRFQRAAPFSSGLAAVTVRSGKVGFIDVHGQLVVPAVFDAAKSFHDGRAPACIEPKGWGFIDAKGAWVVAPQLAFADSFAEGVAVVKTGGEAGRALEGACALPRAPVLGSECEGGEDAEADSDQDGRYFLIDATGARLSERGYHCILRMTEGLAAARTRRRWGYLDGKGRDAIPPRFGRAKPFGEGRAAVWMPDRIRAEEEWSMFDRGKWGFINRRGRFVVLPRYRAAEMGVFSEGLISIEGIASDAPDAAEIGRACAERSRAAALPGLAGDADASHDCGAYLDKQGKVRLVVPRCAFDDAPVGNRSLREFAGGHAEVRMQEPMRIAPLRCAPALMPTVSTFVDLQGAFVPARSVLLRRSPEGLIPACSTSPRSAEVLPFIWD